MTVFEGSFLLHNCAKVLLESYSSIVSGKLLQIGAIWAIGPSTKSLWINHFNNIANSLRKFRRKEHSGAFREHWPLRFPQLFPQSWTVQ
jgi:hypothetical protein